MTDASLRQEIMTRNELTVLAEKRNGLCISAYMPTSWVGADMQQNQIRFKNLIRQAAERLAGYGLKGQDIEDMLAPAVVLQKNSPFWRQQNAGLAIFVGKDFFRYYRVPLEFAEAITVKDRFFLQPLLPLFNQNNRFYVLAVSKKTVRFFQGLGECLIEVEPKNLPKKLDDTIKFDVTERQHRNLPGTRAGATGLFHGHGGWQDESKDQVVRYLNEIDRSILAFMKEEQTPIVFAGVDYLFAAYREINSYGNLLAEAIIGNPDALRPDELGRDAWKIVQIYFRKSQEDAMDQLRQSSGTGLTSTLMKEVVPACCHGRTGILFTAAKQRQWGHYDPVSGDVILHDKEEQGSEDLCDLSAIHTFLNKGVVYEVAPQEMPNNAKLAALFRY